MDINNPEFLKRGYFTLGDIIDMMNHGLNEATRNMKFMMPDGSDVTSFAVVKPTYETKDGVFQGVAMQFNEPATPGTPPITFEKEYDKE
jgi:hypothetical protein